MHGNVWEWCEDTWHGKYNKAPIDGSAWVSNNDDLRLWRGGSWHNYPELCRSAVRFSYGSGGRPSYFIGFRVVCGASRTS
jgi:formylglycine-generating enzyme required for sulfatase activity